MTKSGDIAGPRALEHIVDVVLYMEVGISFAFSSLWIWSSYAMFPIESFFF